MNKKRPKNLDLATMKFPSTAIASILHRISGVIMFLLLPLMLYFLSLSLANESSFVNLQTMLKGTFYKIILWGFGAALIYHLLAGIRHLLMDVGIGEQLKEAHHSALLTIGSAVVLTIFLGIWIW